jgi:predicted dehydrogenase/threonine dehydrogenase-like Zn-dependent dehydrogenase
MLLEFGKAGWFAKARQQPDRVKMVLEKLRTDGLITTIDAVQTKLDQAIPLGYCNVGRVIEDGDRCASEPRSISNTLKTGDRVVSNGPHAEIVSVPRNLCARIPDSMSDEAAAFTVVGAIGLQGIRLIQPKLGEKVVVYGLGLIGLLCVQLLRASGCEVLGIDLNPERLKLAESFGAKTVNTKRGNDPTAAAESWTEGKGVDAVLITATAKTDEIVHKSALMSRKRGRIVLVGVVGLNLRRSDFYEKELTFQVSCSYGPGRYDQSYEQGGKDYPYGLVRWTEQRNFQAVLEMMRTARLTVEPLITHRYEFANALKAYETLSKDSSALGIILQYPQDSERRTTIAIAEATPATPAEKVVVGVIGAGNFSKTRLMPALNKTTARISWVADLSGADAMHLASKYGAGNGTTDYREILRDPATNAVIVAVGHNLHARFVCESLEAGKHVFVEKPMAMNVDELREILSTAKRKPGLQVTVGFNRRFSPHITKIKEALEGHSEPLAMTMTVNAGIIPPDHWVHDPVRGGGRIIGEACHFIDLMVYLSGSNVRTVSASMMGNGVAVRDDKMSITLGFEDGSVGAVNYFANGSKLYPKEMLEVFSEGRVARMDNFRRTEGFGFGSFRGFKTWRQDKGHAAEFAAFVDRVAKGGPPLIPLHELVYVTLATFAAVTAATEIRTIVLADEYADLLELV